MLANPAKEEQENPWRRRKRKGNHWLVIALHAMGGKTNVEYKMHKKLEPDHLISYSLLGDHMHLSPHVAHEAASISKTNRWEAEGCESFLTGQNLSGYREMELVRQAALEIQPTLAKEPLFSKSVRC